MASINWDQSMSVGIRSIDTQHKSLIESINGFYDAINSSSAKELIVNLLKEMKEYSIFHFFTEESLLKKHGYPDLEQHKSEHHGFIKKIEDMDKRLKEGKLVLSLELTSFIKTWITNHIMVIDKKYSAFLISKGVN
jgi:hemerythrin